MTEYKAVVIVTPQTNVNDPEGNVINASLQRLGFSSVNTVRAGKVFNISLTAKDAQAAHAELEKICSELLAHPAVEQYSYELEPA